MVYCIVYTFPYTPKDKVACGSSVDELTRFGQKCRSPLKIRNKILDPMLNNGEKLRTGEAHVRLTGVGTLRYNCTCTDKMILMCTKRPMKRTRVGCYSSSI